MSGRNSAMTAYSSPAFLVRYGNASANFCEPSVATTPERPLVIVWRNPLQPGAAQTGSVRLNVVSRHGDETHEAAHQSYLPISIGPTFGYLPEVIYPSSGFWELGYPEGSIPGLNLTPDDPWGFDQVSNCLPGSVYPSAQYWEIGKAAGALSEFALPSADILGQSETAGSVRNFAHLASGPSAQPVFEYAPALGGSDDACVGKIRMAFMRAAGERFEDGMESQFSLELQSLVRSLGSDSFGALQQLLDDESVSPIVAAEALRWVGRADRFLPKPVRLSLLERALLSGSAIVRDSAALGLASLDDPRLIPALERAVASEAITALRADMQEVLEQLRGR